MSHQSSHTLKKPGYLVLIFILAIIGLLFFYPIWNVFVYAFNDAMDSLQSPVYLFPRKFTINNVFVAFNQNQIYHSFLISVARTIIGTALGTAATSTLAYAMSKRQLPGYHFFSTFFYIPFMFSGGMIPFYLLLNDLHLLNTFWVFVIPGMYNYWNMIIFRSFFDGIPDSIEESVQIDGGSFLQSFLHIVVPMSKSVFATMILFTAVGHWNDWFAGMFYIRDKALMPLQTYLQEMLNQSNMSQTMQNMNQSAVVSNMLSTVTPYAIRMATIVISILPIIIVYPFVQKYFEKGMVLGAVKG